MNGETRPPITEPALPRTRGSVSGGDASEQGIRGALERSAWVRLGVVVVAAAVSGLLLAPGFATPTYPSDPDLLGTPAPANIKAPYAMEVPDRQTTEQLRTAAVARVPRVYDFDVQLGEETADAVREAFGFMEIRTREFDEAHPRGKRPETLSKASFERYVRELAEAVDPSIPEFEQKLGTALNAAEREVLAQARYSRELGEAVARLLGEIMSQPINASAATLEPDREAGISIQRVPEDRAEARPRRFSDVVGVVELESLQKEIGARVRKSLPEMAPRERDLVAQLAARLVQPNLTLNRAATEVARENAKLAVEPHVIVVKTGEMIVRDGDRLTRRQLLVLAHMNRSASGTSTLLVVLGATGVVLLLVLVALSLLRSRRQWQALELRDLLFTAVLFVGSLAMMRLYLVLVVPLHDTFTTVPLEAFLFFAPIATAAVIARLVLKRDMAVVFGLIWCLVLGLLVDPERFYVIYALVGSVLGVTLVGAISARGDLMRIGLWVGTGQAVAAFGLQLFESTTQLSGYLWTVPAAFFGGVLSALLALAFTPAVEWLFGYTTDLKLLELANFNHQALKELIVQAPGSYHHSILVGSLVEAAAVEIGANPLLARAMAYYHDLGKGCNPSYFIENQRSGQNPHDKLKPSMSAMIIRRHVTDGLEIAKRFRLGEQILAGIAEHHGTTLIQYFYNRAKEQADDDTLISETDYRYPGRHPQTRESALVMLGDAVEAACRSLAEPTPARLKGVLNRIINQKFTDGQLEQCNLTLKDLHTIARSFLRVLSSLYHERPEYPGRVQGGEGKKQHTNGDMDPKQAKKTKDRDETSEEDRPDNIRRLGMS